MKRYIVTLTKEEREQLTGITKKGKHSTRAYRNAIVLLNCDEGEFNEYKSTNEEICKIMRIGMRTIDRVKKSFVEDGFEICLSGKKSKRIYNRKTDGDFEAHLIATACSSAPEGYARWSLRLLADKMIELNYIDRLSHETVRRILKKMNLNLGKV